MTNSTPTQPTQKKRTTSTSTKAAPKRTPSARAKKETTSLDLPNNPLVFEILDLVSRQKTKAKKVQVLERYQSIALKSLLIWNFDETVRSALPPGDVPYQGFDESITYSGTLTDKIEDSARKMYEDGNFSLGNADSQGRTTLLREAKHFYHFVEGGNNGLSKIRREMMFINILESVHPLEAEILGLVKDKRLQEKYNITKDVVAEAYPDIRWGGRG